MEVHQGSSSEGGGTAAWDMHQQGSHNGRDSGMEVHQGSSSKGGGTAAWEVHQQGSHKGRDSGTGGAPAGQSVEGAVQRHGMCTSRAVIRGRDSGTGGAPGQQ
jgi:hypothetical protein